VRRQVSVRWLLSYCNGAAKLCEVVALSGTR